MLVLIFAAVMVGLLLGVVWFLAAGAGEDPASQPLLETVRRGPFEHIVLEHGEVESSSNIEIQCEVKARNSTGTAVIWVIPEGTQVQAGDKLVVLDSSALEDEYQRQKILVNTAHALMISAQSTYEQAIIALEEYIDGTFEQEKQLILSEILVAEEKLSRAQENAKFSQRLAALGFQTALQLKADLFAVEQAQTELELARNKLSTLENITFRKMKVALDSDIEAAEARKEADTNSHAEEVKKLKEMEDQIAKCVITAPAAGQVVYANIVSRRGGSEFVVEPGAMVRERQTIIRLPDPDQMQIKATINEDRVILVEEGMPVSIRIGAFADDRILEGRVKKVNRYAEPGSWFSSQVKEYATFIDVINPPPDIRSGMTAEVRILVDKKSDVLQIPVQAIHEHARLTYCLVKKGDTYETRQVKMGATNDKTVVIEEGLDENEQVVLNPRRHLNLMELPEVTKSVSGMADFRGPQPTRGDELRERRSDDATQVAASELPVTDADGRRPAEADDVRKRRTGATE